MPRKPVRRAPGPSLRAVGELGATGADLDFCMSAVAEVGDRAAYGRLVQHFAPRLIGFFANGRATRFEAEELALEALTTLWRDAALYDPRRTTLEVFVFVIARNLLVERSAGPELACAGEEASGADEARVSQAMAKLRAALEGET